MHNAEVLSPPPRDKRNDWHVRFIPPATTASGESSSEVPDQGNRAGKRIAAKIIESFWIDAGRGAEKLKLRNDHATIGDLIERYRAMRRAAAGYGPQQYAFASHDRENGLFRPILTRSTSIVDCETDSRIREMPARGAEKRSTPATRHDAAARSLLDGQLCATSAVQSSRFEKWDFTKA